MRPTKEQRINLRVQEKDRSLFERAAEVHHESLTQFMVESGRERAERVLADRTKFVVNAEGWETMMKAMDRPAQAKPQLADLFSRPRPQ